MSRRRGRIDQNQTEIVEGLRKFGASVEVLSNVGGGVPDLLVGWRGTNYLIEVKSTVTSYGRNGLNQMQQDWHDKWLGHKAVAESLDEAITIISNN